tara:strand:+ start:1535 stop:1918 length:384 start_codon:yes stop_codon:yes gene_type:complete
MLIEIIYIIIGTLAGLSMGIIGVGAGIITIPLLIYSGMNIRTAVGCSLVMQLLPQSLPGVLLYQKKNYIDWYKSILVVLGSLFGIMLGSYFVSNNYITEKMTYKILTVILIITTVVFVKEHLWFDNT